MINSLDEACGNHLSYRGLIECGETHLATGISNIPKEDASFSALLHLAVNILDPVINEFGAIQLTYGFSSPELTRKIKADIAPKIDQHAAHEKNRFGNYICERLGATVDFIVPDTSMFEVGLWIAENTPFDRLYIYGDSKPLHVSYGPEQKSDIVLMEERVMKNGKSRRIPKKLDINRLKKATSK